MARRLQKTMADYVVIAISPALIMVLVGSLVFFLIAVFYQGDYPARLHWVMACFVFAAVLIGRISIEEGFERAAPFGIALAIVVGIAANQFMEFRGWIDHLGWILNWGLIALVWWCAHKLTWDCTVIDDAQDASGEGLLQVAGIERPADQRNEAHGAATKAAEGTTARDVPAGWWQRYVEHQRRPHAPGVWVVYFSLAALPLFGVGQWFIPASETPARRYAFWLLCLYVTSGMGLLLTTSFLGLRRYLRQRRIEMPSAMANLWLGTGAAVILLLVVAAALLPRPSAEYSIARLPFSVGSPQGKSSRIAADSREGVDDEQPGEAPARSQNDESTGDSKQAGKAKGTGAEQSGEESEPGGEQASGQSQASGQEQGESSQSSDSPKSQSQSSSSGNAQAEDKSDTESDNQAAQKPTESGDDSEASKQDSLRDRVERLRKARQSQQADEPPRDDDAAKKSKDQTDEEPSQGEGDRPDEQDKQQQQDNSQHADQGGQPPEPPSTFEMPDVAQAPVGFLAQLLIWAFYAVFAVAVIYFLWRFRAEVLRAIRDFLAALRDFWDGLLGRRRARALAESTPAEIKIPPAPFSTYADPFTTGIEKRYSLDELVRYSFEAFEAWAREHGCEHEPDQTPYELARDVAKLNAHIRTDAGRIAELYSRAAFARGPLPEGAREQLRQLWQAMRQSTGVPR